MSTSLKWMTLEQPLNTWKCAQLHTNKLRGGKKPTGTSIIKDKEQVKSSETANGSVNYFNHFGNCLEVSSKVELEPIPQRSNAIPKYMSNRNAEKSILRIGASVLVATLPMVPQTWEQPNVPTERSPYVPAGLGLLQSYLSSWRNCSKSLQYPCESISVHWEVKTFKTHSSVKAVRTCQNGQNQLFSIMKIKSCSNLGII